MAKGLAEIIAAAAEKHPLEHYLGWDWWQLSTTEEEVFDIERERWPLMMNAYHNYEIFLEIADMALDDDHQAAMDAARRERPDIVEAGFGENGFMLFGALYAGLTNREAWQMYAKREAWSQRGGVLTFEDRS